MDINAFIVFSNFFIDFLLLPSIEGSNIYRGSTYREAEFQRKYKGSVHAATPIKEFETEYVEYCSDKCLETTECKSFNYGDGKCQLIAEDRNTMYNYIKKTGWKHYDTGRTQLTRIYNLYNGACMVPSTKSCDYSPSTKMVISSNPSECDEPYAWYKYDRENGDLFHMCSGARYCSYYVRYSIWSSLYFYHNLPCPEIGGETVSFANRWKRSYDNRLSPFVGWCGHMYAGSSSAGNYIISIPRGCNAGTVHTFNMAEIGNGPVRVHVHGNVDASCDFNCFKKDYIKTLYFHETLYMDSFEFFEPYSAGSHNHDYWVMIMQAIFIAPEDGEYYFYVGCDDWCRLSIGSDENESSAYEIAYNDEGVPMFEYALYSRQISSPITLQKDKKYYMEFLVRDLDGGEWGGVAMKAPSYFEKRQLSAEQLYPIGF